MNNLAKKNRHLVFLMPYDAYMLSHKALMSFTGLNSAQLYALISQLNIGHQQWYNPDTLTLACVRAIELGIPEGANLMSALKLVGHRRYFNAVGGLEIT